MKPEYPIALSRENQNRSLAEVPAPVLYSVSAARQPIGAKATASFRLGAKVQFHGRHTRATVFPINLRLANSTSTPKGLLLDIHI